MKHVSGKVNSRVLFYNYAIKEFLNPVYDFNIHALYNEEGIKIVPTNLKKMLKIDNPEIELIDFNNDGMEDYKFTRLYHNGTANAIEETIIRIVNDKIDTLKLDRKWISN